MNNRIFVGTTTSHVAVSATHDRMVCQPGQERRHNPVNRTVASSPLTPPRRRLAGPCLLLLAIGINACHQIFYLFRLMTTVAYDEEGKSLSLDLPVNISTDTGENKDYNGASNHLFNERNITVQYEDDDENTPLWWKNREHLPLWFQEYCEWHKERRQNPSWNESTWRSSRYLVMTCRQGERCGGAADRLRPALALLRIAAETNRIFLIEWENPAPLEEFLLPPQLGLDWRLPKWLQIQFQRMKRKVNTEGTLQSILHAARRTDKKGFLVSTQYQSPTYGSSYYDENRSTKEGSMTMNAVYPYFWKVLFTPSSAVSQRIQDRLDQYNLSPQKYTSIHLRTYRIEPDQGNDKNTSSIIHRDIAASSKMQRAVENAIRCGTQLQPEGPFFVASDSYEATRMARNYIIDASGSNGRSISRGSIRMVTSADLDGRSNADGNIIYNNSTLQRKSQPIHLGFVDSSTFGDIASDSTFMIEQLYDVFVDLYLLSLGRCVTYGSGGFGQWAYLLQAAVSTTTNTKSCGFRHGKRGKKCSWRPLANS